MIKQILAGIWLFIIAGFAQAEAHTIFVDGFEDYCALTFTDLPTGDWYNGSVCANGTNCVSATITITVAQGGDCTGISSVGLFDGESQLATDSSPPLGGVSVFNVLIDDGAALQLEAKAFESDSEIASTGVSLIKTDFTLPQVEFIAADVDGFQTAATGEHAVYTIFSDLDQVAPGMQFNARVSVADTNLEDGQLLGLTATGAGTVDLIPSNISIPLTLAGATPLAVDLLDLSLADQQTHVISVVGTDAAGNQDSASYTAEVNLTGPPDPPTLLETSPPSPANDNEPEISGTVEAGTTVHLYSDSTCSDLLASGSAISFTTTGIMISVADNTTTTLYADATDATARVSTCSGGLVYVEDSTPPDPPAFLGTIPPSPANENNPRVFGTAVASTIVH